MKYKIIEILFGWIVTPIIHLNLMQIFIAGAEFIALCWIVALIGNLLEKIKDRKRGRDGYKNKRETKYTGYNNTREL